ncbi:MAG: ADP-ribosylglycohydrolase family protein [Alphaproteobacteria bacterium]|jgi:ADP-ribosylglycohydrolase|nr:ADP-ribosylglycohydrolase family protein [Alphaproteobacteria bacterium]
MLGAIIGDIAGSIYEADNIRSKDFPFFGPGSRFTDDTVCTLAVAEALLEDGDVAETLRRYARRYPDAGYGGMFVQWAFTDDAPAYGSWGNGSAMRVAPVAWAAESEAAVLALAAQSAAVTHDHPDAVAGAQATALAIWLARHGAAAAAIRETIGRRFGYDLDQSLADLHGRSSFDVSCRGTVPPALISALSAADFEDAVRTAISLGGDSDTIACIAGSVAEPLYGIPDWMAAEARARLDDRLRAVLDRFRARFRTAPC